MIYGSVSLILVTAAGAGRRRRWSPSTLSRLRRWNSFWTAVTVCSPAASPAAEQVQLPFVATAATQIAVAEPLSDSATVSAATPVPAIGTVEVNPTVPVAGLLIAGRDTRLPTVTSVLLAPVGTVAIRKPVERNWTLVAVTPPK